MNEPRYHATAWLVFTKMGLDVFMLLLAIILIATRNWTLGPLLFHGFVLILVSLITCYALFMLRRLLWERYEFHKLDVIIPVLAVANVVLEVINQFTEVVQATNPAATGPVVAGRILLVIVPWGILNIVFAAGLLKLPFSEKSLLRPFAYLYLAAGVVLVAMILVLASPFFTFILLPCLFITGVGSDIFLGLTFLRSGDTEQVEFV
jgi:hypothetical protein